MNKKLEATLNPNATEFVPFALRSSGKSIFDRSVSLVSTNSEEDALQYWGHHLPDDITPDFKVTGIDNTREINSLSFSNLSLTDINEVCHMSSPAHWSGLESPAGLTHFDSSTSTRSGSMLKASPLNVNGYAEKQRYPVSSYGKNLSTTSFQPSLAKPWEKQIVRNDQHCSRRFLADMSNEQLLLNREDVAPLEFLTSVFPGFASGSLAEVYFANGGDLNLTIEVLTRVELHGDGGFNQTLNPKAISSRNHIASDFPSHFAPDGQNGFAKLAGDDHQNLSSYRSSVKDSTPLFKSFSSDFASPVRKMGSSQDSSIWKYERNSSSGSSIGSSRSSQVLASSYNSAQGKGVYGDRLLNRGAAHASPFWPETGEPIDMYSEIREEARDLAHLHNAYFEQARKAYLIGNKALAKELSIKGQLHNMKIKAAQESIYRQRNPENGRERIIDLHGLGVSEAIHVVKRELAVVRNVARSADQRILVYICVGTRGPCTPARLPTAVQRYLLEEEGLDYSEPQPGVLRVVIF